MIVASIKDRLVHIKESKSRFLLLNALVIFISLLLCELALQLGSSHSPFLDNLTRPPWISRFIIDPRNGYAGNPSFPEHDEWGYRNDRRPASAKIITLGDSWTFGTTVEKDVAWPTILSRLLNKDIYNMAMGGTGPINYLQSFYQSLELQPKIIILSLYFGNDFIFTNRHLHMDHADVVFSDIPENIIQQAIKKNSDNPLNSTLYKLHCGKPGSDTVNRPIAKEDKSGIRAWVSMHSRLYGLMRGLKYQISQNDSGENIDGQDAQEKFDGIDDKFEYGTNKLDSDQRHYCYPFSDGEWKTIFQNRWITYAVDYSDIRISAGMLIVKRVLNLIANKALEIDADFAVILFPTKESVFYTRARNSKEPGEEILRELDSIYENEAALRKDISNYMESEEIGYVDMLPYLKSAEMQPFFGHEDSHPNEFGNRIIAKAVKDLIENRYQ